MRFVPVDHARLETIYVETVGKMQDGAQKVAKDDGRPIWAVRVLIREVGAGVELAKPELVEVAVPSLRDLADVLTPFEPIAFDQLKVFPWSMDGRSGLAFSADGCRTGKPARNGAKLLTEPASSPAA